MDYAAFQIRDLMIKNPDLVASAQSNTLSDFQFSYYASIEDALIKGLSQNQEFFSMLLNDDQARREILGIFVKAIYDDLKGKNKG